MSNLLTVGVWYKLANTIQRTNSITDHRRMHTYSGFAKVDSKDKVELLKEEQDKVEHCNSLFGRPSFHLIY